MKGNNPKQKILFQSVTCKIYIPVAFTLQSISATKFSRNSVPPDITNQTNVVHFTSKSRFLDMKSY